MYKNIKALYSILTLRQKRELIKLQFLIIVMSLAEVVSVLSIGPFMALVGDISNLREDERLYFLYGLTGLSSEKDFLIYLGVFVLAVLTVSSIFSIYTVWKLSVYGSKVGAEISNRLFSHYMQKDWIYHTQNPSSKLTNKVAQESLRITNSIITPLMHINARLILVMFVGLTILIFNPLVAIIAVGVFFISYYILYKLVKFELFKNGIEITKAQEKRLKLMSEGFGSIKELMLSNRINYIVDNFSKESEKFSKALGVNKAIGSAPRYFIELVAFYGIILMVLVLLSVYEGDIGEMLSILSVYALAGMKILPSLQKIYNGISDIKGSIAAFDSVKLDLLESSLCLKKSHERSNEEDYSFKKMITLDKVSFIYPDSNQEAIKNLTINIPANHNIGFVGLSGSGKSTTLDLISGLIQPSSGIIKIDDNYLTEENLSQWQKNISLVPQNIYISDSTIKENIALGLPYDQIDNFRLYQACKAAHLDELIQSLPGGLDTEIGEKGVRLSGGQRQRIGIARALYNNSDILIFDEATSALDNITEDVVMEAISELSGIKTIIMVAHRLSTVRNCDLIYLFEDGCIADYGTYSYLEENSKVFKKMARV